MGAMGLTSALALMVAPWLGLMLLDYSPPTLWLGCGGLGCLAALIILSGPE
jgi:hypothetical protein